MPRSSPPPSEPAPVDPVAHVVVDSPLPHLDRVFDYAVPAALDAAARPGVRVRVRFAGRLIDGWLVGRAATSEHRLSPLHAVVSSEVVLPPETHTLARAVADHWAGVLPDVLRSAIPRRHARAESAPARPTAGLSPWEPGLLAEYRGGRALVERARAGQAPRAVLPTGGDDPAALIAEFVHAVGRAIVVAPDRTAVHRVEAELRARGVDESTWTTLLADDGPEVRYRQWLRALRGEVGIVVGTRSAVFAPIADAPALVVWDEWEESMYDPQAPYWNVRDVAALRSRQQGSALLYVGASVSADLVALVPWVAVLGRDRRTERARAPRVRSAYEAVYAAAPAARIPDLAMHVIREALQHGPVIVLVGRAGYQPRLVCDTCRDSAVCSACQGPLVRTARSSLPMCVHCGQLHDVWSCNRCTGTALRAAATGSERTAEELGRAFPGVPVRSSSGAAILRAIPATSSIVVATPGAVPHAPGGYAAAIILDAAAALSRSDLRAAEDAHSRWCDVVSNVRAGGEVVIAADPDVPAVQALIRRDPVGFAERELAARREVSLPPAVRLILLTGRPSDIDEVAAMLDLAGVTVRGPVPMPDGQARLLLTCARKESGPLVACVKAATAVRATRKAGEPVNVRVDPRSV